MRKDSSTCSRALFS